MNIEKGEKWALAMALLFALCLAFGFVWWATSYVDSKETQIQGGPSP